MRAHAHTGRAARQWYLLVGIRWQRFQGRLSGLYHRRVTVPVRLWRAMGSPSAVRPVIPWWQPFLFWWLSHTGYAPRRTRAEWRAYRYERWLQRWGL